MKNSRSGGGRALSTPLQRAQYLLLNIGKTHFLQTKLLLESLSSWREDAPGIFQSNWLRVSGGEVVASSHTHGGVHTVMQHSTARVSKRFEVCHLRPLLSPERRSWRMMIGTNLWFCRAAEQWRSSVHRLEWNIFSDDAFLLVDVVHSYYKDTQPLTTQ